MAQQDQEDASELKLGLFEKSECLTLSEVYFILKENEEQSAVQMDTDLVANKYVPKNNNFQNSEKKTAVFADTLEYVKKFGRYNTNKQGLNELKHSLTQKNPKFVSYELVKLADLGPENAEEAMALMPSLVSKDTELDDILSELEQFKATQ